MLQVSLLKSSMNPELSRICTSDSATRALPHGTGVTGSVTVESCTTACYNAGYPLAGMEYADECCAHASSVERSFY